MTTLKSVTQQIGIFIYTINLYKYHLHFNVNFKSGNLHNIITEIYFVTLKGKIWSYVLTQFS